MFYIVFFFSLLLFIFYYSSHNLCICSYNTGIDKVSWTTIYRIASLSCRDNYKDTLLNLCSYICKHTNSTKFYYNFYHIYQINIDLFNKNSSNYSNHFDIFNDLYNNLSANNLSNNLSNNSSNNYTNNLSNSYIDNLSNNLLNNSLIQ